MVGVFNVHRNGQCGAYCGGDFCSVGGREREEERHRVTVRKLKLAFSVVFFNCGVSAADFFRMCRYFQLLVSCKTVNKNRQFSVSHGLV